MIFIRLEKKLPNIIVSNISEISVILQPCRFLKEISEILKSSQPLKEYRLISYICHNPVYETQH